MKKIIILILLSLSTGLAADAGNSKPYSFTLTYSFTIKEIPQHVKEIKYWIPLPPQSPSQLILNTSINVPGQHEIVEGEKYKNKILFGVHKNKGNSIFKGSITYSVTRRERLTRTTNFNDRSRNLYAQDRQIYLQPSKLVTLSPRIKKLAAEITKGRTGPRDKAKAIYDYVFENMEYNKLTAGWGYGDTERACDIMQGNCTDFHSLFISLARASAIPAKFVIGFNIPNNKESLVGGYHCWAEFYLKGTGWVPVDISNAWKNKSKKEYYFGNLDKNRIEFTVGRDIILPRAQNQEPLNYFIYPYCEIDGKGDFCGDTLITYSQL